MLESVQEILIKILTKTEEINQNDLIKFIIAALFSIFPFLIKFINYIIKYYRKRKAQKDLFPYFSKEYIKKVSSYYIKARFLKYFNENIKRRDRKKRDIIKHFLTIFCEKGEVENRFFLVLGDTGSGKTTFLINLYLKYSIKFRKRFEILIFPLGYRDIFGKLENVENKGKKILLLDAFDEDVHAKINYKDRIDELIKLVEEFRFVVITCRTQFFPSEQEEPIKTNFPKFFADKGFEEFKRIYIAPFTIKDYKAYLRKNNGYMLKNKHVKRSIKIVDRIPDISIRPLLWNYNDLLIDISENIEFSFQIYELIINKWIERESNIYRDVNKRNEFRTNLKNFSILIAKEIFYNRDKLENYSIHVSLLSKFLKNFSINLTELELRNNSLLNRDCNGNYKFSHKSFWDYLIAKECFKKNIELNQVFLSEEKAMLLLTEMVVNQNKSIKVEDNDTNAFYKNEELIFEINNYFKSIKTVYTPISEVNSTNSVSSEKKLSIEHFDREFCLVYSGRTDKLLGVLPRSKYLRFNSNDRYSYKKYDCLLPPYYIPENKNLLELISELSKDRTADIAICIGKFEKIVGILDYKNLIREFELLINLN